MSNDNNQSLFEKNKNTLEDIFFEIITNRKGLDGKTIIEDDISPKYMSAHPNFVFSKEKNIIIPMSSKILNNPRTTDEIDKLHKTIQKIHNYINENKEIETYTLYSTCPMYEKRVNTPFNYGNFYAFTIEYKAYDKNDQLVACNLYCCTSTPNKVANKNENDEIIYGLDEFNRHLFWRCRKGGYDVLRGLRDDPSISKLSKEDIYNWLTKEITQASRYMMVPNILTNDMDIIKNIDKLDIAEGDFNSIKNHQYDYENN
jgi:hypothetical protein